MRVAWWVSLIVFPAILLLVGCSKKQGVGELTDADTKAFDSAPADVKQTWTTALEASKSNDYVGAQTLLYGLLAQNLSPDQKQAVTKASTLVNQRLYDGVEKGDPAALKAMEDMRRNPPGRQPR